MENIFVEFLPPWVETGLQPAFYDKESGTVLQQTARMYARVNMLIRMFNKLSKNTKTTVEDYINQFNELHDYVHDYFDNLDVQEEINNKLDQMAEDGVLADIIAQYLTLAGLLAYSTVADLANASNVAVGSKCRTLGYKRLGDGVYDLYTIREVTNSDVVDGYNIVRIASTQNLIAERVQTGEHIVVKLETTDDINDYLALPSVKTIILPANTTYTAESKVFINSDTTIDLNGSTLECDYDNDSETFIFCYGLTDTSTEYNGNKNITIKNGAIKNACICMMHNRNVKIDGVSFVEPNSRHDIQIAGCYDVTVTNCLFNGTLPINDTGSECINIDPCIYSGQPYMDEESVMYDHTPNMFITISNNKFNKPTTDGYRYTNAVGSHEADSENQTIAENVIIDNNNFGTPYAHVINVCDYINTDITNNEVVYDTSDMYSGDTVRFVYVRGGYTKLNIIANSITNAEIMMNTPTNTLNKQFLVVRNNHFVGKGDGDSGVIWMRNTHDVVIDNNYIKTSVACIFMDCHRNGTTPIEGTETRDVVISNNTLISTATSTSGAIKIRGNSYNVLINDNTIEKYDNASWVVSASSVSAANNIKIVGNSCNFNTHFIPNALVTKNVYNNNALVTLTSSIEVLNGTVTPDVSVDRFKSLLAMIGYASGNLQSVHIRPYIPSDEYIATTNNTWKFPLCKSDGTLVSATFATSDNSTSINYNGNGVAIRRLYGVI